MKEQENGEVSTVLEGAKGVAGTLPWTLAARRSLVARSSAQKSVVMFAGRGSRSGLRPLLIQEGE